MTNNIEKGIFLLLGTNLGDRYENLLRACHLISESIGEISKSSSIYITAPWGVTDQPDFYNNVIEVDTPLDAEHVLTKALEIESKMGRVRMTKWGSRLIDIDLLFYNQLIVQSPHLTLPHPALADRMFTLLPLEEIAPAFLHPIINKDITTLRQLCRDTSQVKKIELKA